MLLVDHCPICRSAGPAPCASCAAELGAPPARAPVPVVFAFEGTGRRLVLALKYANGRSLVRPIVAIPDTSVAAAARPMTAVGQPMTPFRTAYSTISAVFRSESFSIRFARWVSTVETPTSSAAATSLFERPSAMS